MYEIYGVAYGWNVTRELPGWVAEEYLSHLGGQRPYAGSGEATTYIGIDITGLGVDSINNGLTLDQFNADVQRKLAKELKANQFAQNVSKWRQSIILELDDLLNDGEITVDEYDGLVKKIKTEPTLFWTWSTS